MNSSKILDVLKWMLKDYERTIDSENMDELMTISRKLATKSGFCHWLDCKFYTVHQSNLIIEELRNDLTITHRGTPFWYKHSSYDMPLHVVKENHLKPRIEHLKRTITRLGIPNKIIK